MKDTHENDKRVPRRRRRLQLQQPGEASVEAGHAQWYLERRHATLTIMETAEKALKASSGRRNVILELEDASPCFQCLLRLDIWLDSGRQSA